jgi:hypothetical protein
MSTERAPQNYVERMVWLWGRKFWLAFFAGSSSFVAFVIGVWIVARVPNVDRARLIESMVGAYFLAAAAVIAAYSGANAIIERAHAGKDAQPPKRQSGTVTTPETE